MVQILQAGPSEATLRQQALNEGLQQAMQGLQAYAQVKEKQDLTKRQQALQKEAVDRQIASQDLASTLKLQEMGVASPLADVKAYAAGTYKPQEISPAQPAQYETKQLAGPVRPGEQLGSTQTEIAPARPAVLGPANPLQNYTEAKKAKMAADLAKQDAESKILAGKVDAIPLDNQKKQADIQKIQNDVQMRPIEKQAKLADIEWKHAMANDKVDQKTNERFSKLAKEVANPTTRNALGNFGKNLASADRIKALTDSFSENLPKNASSEQKAQAYDNMTTKQVEEVTKSLDSLLSGGASTISGADHLRFETLRSHLSDALAKYGNSPQPAKLGKFVQQAMETVERERAYNGKQIDRILSGTSEGFSDLKKKDEGRFNAIIKAAYTQEAQPSRVAPIAPPAPGQDPAFEAWKKAKGHI